MTPRTVQVRREKSFFSFTMLQSHQKFVGRLVSRTTSHNDGAVNTTFDVCGSTLLTTARAASDLSSLGVAPAPAESAPIAGGISLMPNYTRLCRKAAMCLWQNGDLILTAVENSNSVVESLKGRTKLLADNDIAMMFNKENFHTEADFRYHSEFFCTTQRRNCSACGRKNRMTNNAQLQSRWSPSQLRPLKNVTACFGPETLQQIKKITEMLSTMITLMATWKYRTSRAFHIFIKSCQIHAKGGQWDLSSWKIGLLCRSCFLS